jgi:hypothetical protein
MRALPTQYRRTSPYHPANRHPRSIWPAVILLAIVLAMVVYLASLVRVAAEELQQMGTQQTIATDTYKEEG